MAFLISDAATPLKKGEVENARKILGAYEIRGCVLTVSDDGSTSYLNCLVKGDSRYPDKFKEDWFMSPKAVLRAELPKRDAFASDEKWNDAVSRYIEKFGMQGFYDLLSLLGFCLALPMVFAVGTRRPDDPGVWHTDVFFVLTEDPVRGVFVGYRCVGRGSDYVNFVPEPLFRDAFTR